MKRNVFGSSVLSWATLLVAGSVAGWTQELPAPRFAERADVLAVSVWIRGQGEGLTKENLEVLVDGQPVQVLALEPLASAALPLERPARAEAPSFSGSVPQGATATPAAASPPTREVAVVIAAHLCSKFCRAEASRVLARDAEGLVRLGPVRVVVARFSGPQELARGVRDAEVLRRFAQDELPKVWVENTFQKEVDALSFEVLRRWGDPGRFGPGIGEVSFGLRAAARLRLIQEQIQMAVASGKQAPATILVLFSDGFEAFPSRIWPRFMAGMPGALDAPWEQAALDLGDQAQPVGDDPAAWFARHLAAEGVVAVPYFLGTAGNAFFPGAAASSGACMVQEFMTVGYAPKTSLKSMQLLRSPGEGLKVLAAETGGAVVPAGEPLTAVWSGSDLYLLTYQVGGVPDGNLHRLEVRHRDGQRLWAPAYVRHGAASLGDEGAARALLAWGQTPGHLPVTAELSALRGSGKSRETTLTVRADFSSVVTTLRQVGLAQLALVVAVDLGDPDPFLYRAEFQEDVRAEEGATWTFQGPMRLPTQARKLAVLVEEKGTGARGGTVLPIRRER